MAAPSRSGEAGPAPVVAREPLPPTAPEPPDPPDPPDPPEPPPGVPGELVAFTVMVKLALLTARSTIMSSGAESVAVQVTVVTPIG